MTVDHIPVTLLMIHACLTMEGEKLKWASSPGKQLRALQIGVSVPVVEEAVLYLLVLQGIQKNTNEAPAIARYTKVHL